MVVIASETNLSEAIPGLLSIIDIEIATTCCAEIPDHQLMILNYYYT